MTTEEVIRKRLLIEGESGADDRRIGSLLKLFVKWSESDESAEERYVQHERNNMNVYMNVLNIEGEN